MEYSIDLISVHCPPGGQRSYGNSDESLRLDAGECRPVRPSPQLAAAMDGEDRDPFLPERGGYISVANGGWQEARINSVDCISFGVNGRS
ncbi:hypothetical protein SBP02_05190 [Pseudomonas benzenivorans]|uniref:Uncharacterized protein n=1 Tax=Pseudomonas benzenivorans TaxID=556533 RepID=A0ABZ0PYF3_9PSED|nr:hypothetical protein [Pseudomonas benzenivorans]WPC06151.1 hypothetical protein SBP02_05190 [Pseudomonas benzenivorans]